MQLWTTEAVLSQLSHAESAGSLVQNVMLTGQTQPVASSY